MLRRPLLVAALCLLAPAARADVFSIGVEGYGGLDKYDALGLKSGVSNISLSDKQLLRSANRHFGLAGILKLGMLEAGVLADSSRASGGATTTAVGGLVGLGIDFGNWRLEALGEVGGRRYGDFLKDPQVVIAGEKEVWLGYAGLRPGLSYRTDGFLKLMVGVWAFARWDVSSKDVPVTITPSSGGPSTSATYKLGGSTFGASARVGVYF